MAAVNKIISYAAVATVEEVLDALLTAMTTGGATELGWILLEDNNDGLNGDGSHGQFFAIENQKPSLGNSRMILEFRFVLSVNDYIAVTLWRGPWVATITTTKGTGSVSTQSTDATFTVATDRDRRYHRLDLTNGGTFYLDGDDTIGKWLCVHSEFGSPTPDAGTRSDCGHFFSVCSIEKDHRGTGYGVLAFLRDDTNRHFSAWDAGTKIQNYYWVPPRDHGGRDSSDIDCGNFTAASGEQTRYWAGGPMHRHRITTNGVDLGGMAALDTYNPDDMLFPIHVGNPQTGGQGTPAGYRGILHGVFLGRTGWNLAWRSIVVADGANYVVYSGGPADPGSTDGHHYLAVPAA